LVVLGRARPWRSVKREHVTFQNGNTFEVAGDRSSGCQAADSRAYHNRMLSYGGEYHDDGLASFPVPYRRANSEVFGSEARWGHKLVSDPLLMPLTDTESRVRTTATFLLWKSALRL
jgi:hypothetical protein